MQELSKAERAALFKQQNQAKIDAKKAEKEAEKKSKADRAAIQVWSHNSASFVRAVAATHWGL